MLIPKSAHKATGAAKTLTARMELHPLSILRMVWKRKLWVVAAWVAVSAGTYTYVKGLPSVYSADALIVVESPNISERIVPAIVLHDFQSRVLRIGQEIQSSARLREIMDETGLYAKRRGRANIEDLVDEMRNNIKVTFEGPGRGANGFRIAFEGPEPSQVAQVVNRLGNLYVAENLKSREDQAEGTVEFIDAQLQTAKKKLDSLDAAISRYKVEHSGELPQQAPDLAGSLARVQMDIRLNAEAVQRLQDHKQLLENTLAAAQDTIASLGAPPEAVMPATPGQPAARAAQAAVVVRPSDEVAEELRMLRTRYTDAHPDVKRLQQKLARMREEEMREPPPPAAVQPAPAVLAERGKKPALRPPTPPANPQLAAARERAAGIQAQIEAAGKELEDRKTQSQRLQKQADDLQRRIQLMPVREQEYAEITRDYEITKNNYQALMNKKLSTDMSTDLERRQKAERFTMLEAARVPPAPSKPNRRVMYAMGSGLGMALGIGLALALEIKKGVLLGEWELPEGYPVLGRLPRIEPAKVKAA